VCVSCAQADPELKPWQELVDVHDAMGTLMQRAPDRLTRLLFADLLADNAQYFAEWRNPPGEAPDL
jgi:hypothetical protein